MFNIGKTAAASIIKNEASIRKEYEEFKVDLKRKRKGQFNDINGILYEWFKKCCAASFYPDGPMLKKEAMEIKKCLEKVEFKNFTASNGWLEKCKISYGVRERKVKCEAGEVAEYRVSAWMDKLVELYTNIFQRILTHFKPLVSFDTPWKYQPKNLWFSDDFSG